MRVTGLLCTGAKTISSEIQEKGSHENEAGFTARLPPFWALYRGSAAEYTVVEPLERFRTTGRADLMAVTLASGLVSL